MARKITTEYKCECAELVIKHGYNYQDAANAMGVESAICNWKGEVRKLFSLFVLNKLSLGVGIALRFLYELS